MQPKKQMWATCGVVHPHERQNPVFASCIRVYLRVKNNSKARSLSNDKHGGIEHDLSYDDA
eukprot:4339146-Amphidinium_carterae.1